MSYLLQKVAAPFSRSKWVGVGLGGVTPRPTPGYLMFAQGEGVGGIVAVQNSANMRKYLRMYNAC